MREHSKTSYQMQAYASASIEGSPHCTKRVSCAGLTVTECEKYFPLSQWSLSNYRYLPICWRLFLGLLVITVCASPPKLHGSAAIRWNQSLPCWIWVTRPQHSPSAVQGCAMGVLEAVDCLFDVIKRQKVLLILACMSESVQLPRTPECRPNPNY